MPCTLAHNGPHPPARQNTTRLYANNDILKSVLMSACNILISVTWARIPILLFSAFSSLFSRRKAQPSLNNTLKKTTSTKKHSMVFIELVSDTLAVHGFFRNTIDPIPLWGSLFSTAFEPCEYQFQFFCVCSVAIAVVVVVVFNSIIHYNVPRYGNLTTGDVILLILHSTKYALKLHDVSIARKKNRWYLFHSQRKIPSALRSLNRQCYFPVTTRRLREKLFESF